MGLRDIEHTLPPGFRFYPSDEELVCHYLYKKIANEEVLRGTLVEIDLHTCEPWQLPDVAKLNSNEWYFFSFRDRKYATGYRTNRATESGYWKATGKDRPVFDLVSGAIMGMRKTLVFYRNRAPNGVKTGWIMHEFRLENPRLPPKEDWVLCRVFQKSRSCENYSNQYHDHTSTAGASSPNLAISPTSHVPCLHQNITSLPNNNNITPFHDYHQLHDHNVHGCHQNPSTSLASSAVESGYIFHLPSSSPDHYRNHNRTGEGEFEADYGFIFGLDYSNEMPSNGTNHCLDDMRVDNDGSLIFI